MHMSHLLDEFGIRPKSRFKNIFQARAGFGLKNEARLKPAPEHLPPMGLFTEHLPPMGLLAHERRRGEVVPYCDLLTTELTT